MFAVMIDKLVTALGLVSFVFDESVGTYWLNTANPTRLPEELSKI
jgi:hypothetical protein